MAHVICRYTVENVVDDCLCAEDRFLEGDYKKVSWDGAVLSCGRKKIYAQEYFEQELRDNVFVATCLDDIKYLSIDGVVYVDQ